MIYHFQVELYEHFLSPLYEIVRIKADRTVLLSEFRGSMQFAQKLLQAALSKGRSKHVALPPLLQPCTVSDQSKGRAFMHTVFVEAAASRRSCRFRHACADSA